MTGYLEVPNIVISPQLLSGQVVLLSCSNSRCCCNEMPPMIGPIFFFFLPAFNH